MKTSAEAVDYIDELHASKEFRERLTVVRRAAARGIPFMMGGAEAPVSHPLLPPTISGNDITVDMMLNNPTRVTRLIADLTLQRFIADRLFSSSGGVTGGAVIYDQATENELYASRDVQKVAPGMEFPLVTSERGAPKVAEVEKWGGKFFITDEARERNDSTVFMNHARRLGNTIVRKINARTMAEVETSIAASGQSFGTNLAWASVVTGGSSQSPNANWPLRDFVKAKQLAETQELGVELNIALLNPIDYANLILVYGAQNLPAVLSAINYSLFVSNRVAAGSAYFAEEGTVGEMRIEKPLSTESWREPKTERNWNQTSVRPVFFITNPYSIFKVTGIS